MNILENDTRLSHSLLWNLQQEAYCQFGIQAWNRFGVPSYITSNPYTAKCYAQVVLGYIRDIVIDPSFSIEHPLYLLDLGAGTGRFAYFFLKELFELLESSTLPKIKICYVMTDIVESNLDFWQNHPYFKTYFEQGVVDCAHFHHAQNNVIHLVRHNKDLSPELFVNPLILICNYFFDTIPQDLFRYTNGQLEEGRISLSLDKDKLASLSSNPAMINQLRYSYTYHPIPPSHPYYESPLLNTLINSYSKTLEGYPFLFPIGAFQTLLSFIKWSQSRLLLLAGDQGVCTPAQIRKSGNPKIAFHGSFSLSVNYHAIAQFFSLQGGKAWLTSFSDPLFVVMSGALGLKDYPETSLAFKKYLDSFEPTDYYNIVSLIEEAKSPSLSLILLLIKLGNWDASLVVTFYAAIREALPNANEKQQQTLIATIDKVWDHFYPIGPSSGDFVLNLGTLLLDMKQLPLAKTYFERSLQLSGPNEKVLKNIAACE